MIYTPVEWIALAIILLSAIKIVVGLFSPKSWMGFAKKVWASSGIMSFLGLALGAVILYYLLQEITIVQILAVTAFVACLFMVGLSDRANEIIKLYEKQIKDGSFIKKHILYIIIWIALMVWGLKEILM
jgi:hypothetical protein